MSGAQEKRRVVVGPSNKLQITGHIGAHYIERNCAYLSFCRPATPAEAEEFRKSQPLRDGFPVNGG